MPKSTLPNNSVTLLSQGSKPLSHRELTVNNLGKQIMATGQLTGGGLGTINGILESLHAEKHPDGALTLTLRVSGIEITLGWVGGEAA